MAQFTAWLGCRSFGPAIMQNWSVFGKRDFNPRQSQILIDNPFFNVFTDFFVRHPQERLKNIFVLFTE